MVHTTGYLANQLLLITSNSITKQIAPTHFIGCLTILQYYDSFILSFRMAILRTRLSEIPGRLPLLSGLNLLISRMALVVFDVMRSSAAWTRTGNSLPPFATLVIDSLVACAQNARHWTSSPGLRIKSGERKSLIHKLKSSFPGPSAKHFEPGSRTIRGALKQVIPEPCPDSELILNRTLMGRLGVPCNADYARQALRQAFTRAVPDTHTGASRPVSLSRKSSGISVAHIVSCLTKTTRRSPVKHSRRPCSLDIP